MSRPSMWTALLLPAALLLAAAAADGLTAKPGCQPSCGNVEIPYPFGIGKECCRLGFEISCVNNTAYLQGKTSEADGIEVLNLSVMPRPEARVKLPVAYQCYNVTGDITGPMSEGEVNFNKAGVYRMSNTHNDFFVLGCNTFAYINSGPPGRYRYSYYTGCVAFCNDSRSAQDNECDGVGCCSVAIPRGLTSSWTLFKDGGSWSHKDQEFSPCDYAFIVEKGQYKFRADDLLHMGPNRTLPLVLDWAIREGDVNSTASLSCARAANGPDYTCASDHSECIDSYNGPGYVCNCTEHYEGNPYLKNGCRDIDECELRKQSPELGSLYPCSSDGICKNRLEGYDCPCKPGMRGNGKAGTCVEKFPLAAKLVIGIVVILSVVVVALLSAVITFQKRQLFRKNGGKKLANVESIMFFTKSELKKITGNYANLLGKGCFGEVYAGTLADKDKTKVAVKTCVVVDKANVDEFTTEVEIQSKMIHKNVLKLKGCCLEVKRPMLVYEFAANGSLEGIVHGKENAPLPLERRLDIAIGSAQGLAYMHTHTGSNIIQHGDVKPGNILLDGEFVPKIADFGLSKLIGQGKQYAELVKGSKGYMDPVYHLTGHLTPASDVYSFGVVLLELIARKPIVYGEDCSLIMEFQRVYEQQNSGRKMFDQEIAATQEDFAVLEGIGRLAIQCLAREVKDRPDMTKVATRLAMLKEEWKHGKTNLAGGDNY